MDHDWGSVRVGEAVQPETAYLFCDVEGSTQAVDSAPDSASYIEAPLDRVVGTYEARGGTVADPGGAGPPGTGKMTVAGLVATVLHAHEVIRTDRLVTATRADLAGRHIGQTAPKVRQKIIEAFEGVLVIDEAYTLVPRDPADYGPRRSASWSHRWRGIRTTSWSSSPATRPRWTGCST